MPDANRWPRIRLACVAVLLCAANAVRAAEQPADPPLVLRSVGVFFVGGTRVAAPYSDERDARFPTTGRTVVARQAKVTYMLPQATSGLPVILVPGFGLNSAIYLATPDGREGWAQHFARRGHPVYVIDMPDRGATGFEVDRINACLSGDPSYDCATRRTLLGRTSLEQPWSVWGFGPRFGELYPESRFPALPLEERYVGQFGASFDVYVSAEGAAGRDREGSAAFDALAALLTRTGPAALVLHSAAGAAGFAVAAAQPESIKALVAIETVRCPNTERAPQNALLGIPFLGLWGDRIDERTSGGHPERRRSCRALANAVAATGTPAQFIDLPDDMKIRGNSHLMMQDDNHRQLSDLIGRWMDGLPGQTSSDRNKP